MNLKNAFHAAKLFIAKNRTILGNTARPAQKGRVNLDWWRPLDGTSDNLGDYLSQDIVSWMLARKSLSLDDKVGKTRFLAAVGSILQTGINDCTVWGSGLIAGGDSTLIVPRHKRMDIRALRGPRTAETLRSRGYDCPDVFGDPAIIVPLMYQPAQAARSGVLCVSHFKDHALFEGASFFDMQTIDWKAYVDAVCATELVISTSLHGIILAECFGTPAVLVASDRSDYSLFKYEDWYLSTGRKTFPIAHSVEEARIIKPAPLPDFALLDELRDCLMAAFPYDLWEA